MSWIVRVRPSAEADIRLAFAWYEERQSGLGKAYIVSVEQALHFIEENPLQCAVVYKNVRRALTRRFPYAVFYLVTESKVIVLAVLHQARDPKRWRTLSL